MVSRGPTYVTFEETKKPRSMPTPHFADLSNQGQRRKGRAKDQQEAPVGLELDLQLCLLPTLRSWRPAHDTVIVPEDKKPSLSTSPVSHFLHKSLQCWTQMMTSSPVPMRCKRDTLCRPLQLPLDQQAGRTPDEPESRARLPRNPPPGRETKQRS